MLSDGAVYLDFAGAAVAEKGQLEAVFNDLKSLTLGNPHSRNPSSRICTELVNQARYRILAHFHTTKVDYSVVFCSGATAALKLVAECFDFGEFHNANQNKNFKSGTKSVESPSFVYLLDNHTSVLGMRELVKNKAKILCVSETELENLKFEKQEKSARNLIVFPAQSNFSGRKYPLDWITKFSDPENETQQNFVCLDAAAFVATNSLDLSIFKPDFVTLSFYKIFGYPTGLGALLVRNQSAEMLKKQYFGGGTVMVSVPGQDFHRDKEDVSERFEDGTIDYLGITSLKHGFDTLENYGGMNKISGRVFALAQFTAQAMLKMKHGNGTNLAKIYCHSSNFTNPQYQGGIIAFNLQRNDASFIEFTEVEKMAELYNINLRTGCFCNQGACQMFLGLSDQQIRQNFNQGKVCGDAVSLIDGRPVGCVRISYGFSSVLADAQSFLAMLYDCFLVDSSLSWTELWNSFAIPPILLNDEISNFEFPAKNLSLRTVSSVQEPLKTGLHLTDIFIYPVKSCAPMRVEEWETCETGLLYDRKWMICSKQGAALTQKRWPKMCEIGVKIENQRLWLESRGASDTVEIPLENVDEMQQKLCQNDVCADSIATFDCGSEASVWLSSLLSLDGCRLRRQTNDVTRTAKQSNAIDAAKVSLANEHQYLVLHRASIRQLLPAVQTALPSLTENDLIVRFRPNLVLDGGRPFEEEQWRSLQIGALSLQAVGLCQRCQMICVEPETGRKNPAVLTALRDFRQGKMTFGVYFQARPAETHPSISISDPVKNDS